MNHVPVGNYSEKYASTNPIARRLMSGFLRALDGVLPAGAPATVFELGVGEGEIAARVRHRYGSAFIAGLDLADHGLAAEWRARGVVGVFGDAATLPLRDQSVDLVLAIEVLEHLADPGAALAELARVARRDLIVSVPNEPLWRALNMARGSYWPDFGNTPGHVQHWRPKQFVALVGERFDVVRVAKPLPWTLISARARPRR